MDVDAVASFGSMLLDALLALLGDGAVPTREAAFRAAAVFLRTHAVR